LKPRKIINLSHLMFNFMPAWPTSPNFIYELTRNVARDRVTMHVIRQMTTHTGTHIDTSLHFIVGGKTVDQLPIEAFTGEGVVVDLSHKNAGEEITEDDLSAFDQEIKAGDVLMLYTGWGSKLGYTPEYLFEWPYLAEESAKYLVSKMVKAIGIDGLSIGGWDRDLPGHGPIARKGSPAETHRILLGADIILIEALTNLDVVLEGRKSNRAYFIYAPVALKGAEGGPCRALALMF